MDDSIFSQLPPEALAQLMELGVLDEQGSQLEQQLQQAQALRQSSAAQQQSTGLGAGFAGLGDIIRGVQGALKEKGLRKRQEELLGKKTAGRSVLADLLRSQANQPKAGLQPAVPGPSFGLQSLQLQPFGF